MQRSLKNTINMLLELAFKFAFEWSLKNREPILKAIIDTDTRKNERQKDRNIYECVFKDRRIDDKQKSRRIDVKI